MLAFFIIMGIVLSVFLPLFFLRHKITKNTFEKLVKIFSIVIIVLVTLRGFLNDNFIWVVNGGTYGEIYYDARDYLQSFLRWGLMVTSVVYPCACFFTKKSMKNIAIYICFPIVLISLCNYKTFLDYFITSSGRAIYAPEMFRHIEFSLELILMMIIPLLLRFCLGNKFNIKSKKEWLYFILLTVGSFFVAMPVTLPQSLFGYTKYKMNVFSSFHLMWVLSIFAVYIVLYMIFRFKDKETRFELCVFLSIFLFLHYNSIYLMDLNMKRLPFQLCNLGSYLILISLILKKQPFYNFIFLANVPGALIAFCAPDINNGLLSYWNIHFYFEHMWVFIIPLLMVSLRIMERPNKTAWKHFFIGFSTYFVFCATAGIIANSFLYDKTSLFFNEVNYFYLFDDTVLTALPSLIFLYDWAVTINGYTFYPLYMTAIYILFSVFCYGFYYVYVRLCKVGDEHFNLRKIRIEKMEKWGRYKRRPSPPKDYYVD